MNNIVGSIFYESFVEKKGFVDLVNSARDPIEKLKKKKKRGQTQMRERGAQSKRSFSDCLESVFPSTYAFGI